MIRTRPDSADPIPSRASATEGPRRREKLTVNVVETLERRIAGGSLIVGARLPTEQQLSDAFKVSRTVIREAIAELRARGLVEPRQGVGVFVTRPVGTGAALLAGDFTRLPEILELLEFRMALEIEAAALAAIRRSPRQEGEILAAHDEMSQVIARGDSAVEADFSFHLAIAEATNNQFYPEILQFLGRRTIPRSRVDNAADASDYLQKVHREHGRILAAIEAQNAEEARLAMRHHLTESQRRYRALAATAREATP